MSRPLHSRRPIEWAVPQGRRAVIKVELSVPRKSNATSTTAATPAPAAAVADGDAEHEGDHGRQSLIFISTWYGRIQRELGDHHQNVSENQAAMTAASSINADARAQRSRFIEQQGLIKRAGLFVLAEGRSVRGAPRDQMWSRRRRSAG